MFPAGKKKLLHQLQITRNPRTRRQLLESLSSPLAGSGHAQRPSPHTNQIASSRLSQEGETTGAAPSSKGHSIAAKDVWQYRDSDSSDPDVRSAAIQLIRAAGRYRWDRDGGQSRALDTPNLNQSEFRKLLDKVFDLRLHDVEYTKFVQLFSSAGIIDGTQFLKAFIKLGSMEKARVAAEARRGEPRAGAETATRAASPGLEEETRDVVLVSRNFDQAARTSAFDKLRGAAKLYNKNHPSAFSLESFSCSCMAILEFKELVRRIFSLNFNEYELGAILEEFESSECSNSVDCSRFLVHFTRAGSLAREQELREARAKSRQAKQMEDQKKMALKEEQKMVTQEVLATAVTEVDRAAMQNKLIAAAKSYDKNHPSAMGLGAFEVASIAIPEFWYLIRLTFNLSLNRAEFHALIQYLGTDANGQIRCNDFLVKFLKIGREAKDNDRRQVIKENQTAVSSGVKTLQTEMQMSAVVDPSEYETCREEDFSSAWNKLRHSVYLHAKNETSLLGANSFDKKYVTLSELKRITKYVFKCSLSHDELLGLVKNYDDDRLGVLCSQSFLRDLRKANFEVRERIRAEEIKAKEVSSPNLKSDLSVDSLASDATFTTTDFDESDFSSAFGKLTHAAANYDRYHPSSVGLDGFESKYLLYSEFAELLRRTFNLRLNAREMSALLRHFDPDCRNSIISSDFIRVFFKIGIEERSRCHHEALKKRRESTVISAREVERSHTAAAYGRCYVDYAFEKADEDSAFKKFHDAAFKFDKSHPASFSLNSFEVSAMRVTEFRDMISRALGLRFTPKEFGALLVHFNASEDELINPQKFISEFLRTGISLRHKFNSDLLVAKRDLLKQREQDADMKHRARIENREDDVDWNFSPGDSESAFTKLKQAAFVFDKNMPSAPSLNGFSCKYLEARVFREMARLVFNLKLTPKEVAAIVKHYDVSGKNVLDCASFLTDFLRNGVHLRALEEEAQRKKKREHDRVIELQKSKKLEDSANRADFTPDFKFSEMDVVSAEQKLLDAAVKFDKSASSGSVGLSAFDSQKLSYGNFREVLKLCFGLKLNNRELTSLAVKFDPESSGSVNSTQFLHFFLKLGIDERSRLRNAQLAQNREKLLLLRAEEDEKLKIASKVNEIEIDFDVSNEIKDRAFEKLTAAAARYDPYHPASIPATAFDCKVMGPATFRDMARRTFNLNLSTKELGAIFTNFGASASNPSIRCQEFMVYFIKTGFNEREKCRAVSLRLQKEHELFEKKSREEILMQQEILNELKVDWDFDENDAKNAVKKFIAAAKDYDPNHPSAVGLDAFSQKQMSVEVFREMMKRILGLRLSPRELGALVDYFDKEKNKMVDCGDFLTKLVVLGSNERDKIRSLQRAQEMASFERSKREEEERRKDVENRSDIAVDYEFNVADLKVALEKLEKGIGSYDKYHPAAVPLTSFEASTLSPGQFREQLKLIFGAVLGAKELGALVIHFKTDGDDRIVDCAKFLHHYSAVRRNLKAEEAESKRLARLEIQERRDKIRKEMESRHEDEMKSILLHSSDDERRLTSTLRHCARKFVIDSASFVEYLQTMKNKAFPPAAFREIFYRIFLMKLSYPEVGVLLQLLGGDGPSRCIDGQSFVKLFYKLARLEETEMLQGKSISDSDILLRNLLPDTAASPPRQTRKTQAWKKHHVPVVKVDSRPAIRDAIDKDSVVSSPQDTKSTVRFPPGREKRMKSVKALSVFVPSYSTKAVVILDSSYVTPESSRIVTSSIDATQALDPCHGDALCQVEAPCPTNQVHAMQFYFPFSSAGGEADPVLVSQSNMETEDYAVL